MLAKNIIRRILRVKQKEVRAMRGKFSEELLKAAAFSVGGEFRSLEISLRQASSYPLIVDLKRNLFPQAVSLQDFDMLRVLKTLVKAGLKGGVIVASDSPFLGGDPSWVGMAKSHSTLPVIQRDFFIDPVQIYQARAIGADGVILNPDVLSFEQLPALVDAAGEMGLETYLELSADQIENASGMEGLNGVIIQPGDASTGKTTSAGYQRLRKSLPAGMVKLLKTFPQKEDDLQGIVESAFEGVVLDDRLWETTDFASQFSQVHSLCSGISRPGQPLGGTEQE